LNSTESTAPRSRRCRTSSSKTHCWRCEARPAPMPSLCLNRACQQSGGWLTGLTPMRRSPISTRRPSSARLLRPLPKKCQLRD
jgi:hypothetical protein